MNSQKCIVRTRSPEMHTSPDAHLTKTWILPFSPPIIPLFITNCTERCLVDINGWLLKSYTTLLFIQLLLWFGNRFCSRCSCCCCASSAHQHFQFSRSLRRFRQEIAVISRLQSIHQITDKTLVPGIVESSWLLLLETRATDIAAAAAAIRP